MVINVYVLKKKNLVNHFKNSNKSFLYYFNIKKIDNNIAISIYKHCSTGF